MTKSIKDVSSKIEIPLNSHVNIRIKSDFPIDNEDLNKLNVCYNTAVQRVKASLKELKYFLRHLNVQRNFLRQSTRKNFAAIIKLLKHHFNIDPESNLYSQRRDIKTLIDTLSRIYNGLMAEKNAFYIANGSQKMKYSAWGYTHENSVHQTIYLNLPVLLASDQNYLIMTIIHEASHLFSFTRDYDCYYSERSDSNFIYKKMSQLAYNCGLFKAKETLSTEQRISHASSIENFILELTTTSNALKRSTKLNEEIPGGKLIAPERPNKTFLQKITTFSPIPTMLVSSALSALNDAKKIVCENKR